MSDPIKHECGVSLIRLKKPLTYYHEKYGTALYGLNKLYLLMEKQHNRGQDGAGVASIKLDMPPGTRYISRHRSNKPQPIQEVFKYIHKRFTALEKSDPKRLAEPEWLKHHMAFVGEVYLGHVRYGTYGKNNIENCHPLLRINNWMTRNLVLAGNFNLTNVDELFNLLVSIGQHPKEKSDTVTVLEKIGHFLDEENQALFDYYKRLGYNHREISEQIAKGLNVQRILSRAAADWDGGYTMAGMIGHGAAFVLRDPHGIRPAFYFENDEITAVASERPALQTAFDLKIDEINEIPPGNALIIAKDGITRLNEVCPPEKQTSCSFERIYFSRGSDTDIYKERLKLGHLLSGAVLKAVDYDFDNTVFSFIPNTAEVAFYGLTRGLEEALDRQKAKEIAAIGKLPDAKKIKKILNRHPRFDKIAIKDVKLRTFITQDTARDDMVAHVYDVTYGVIRENKDTLVVIDDSVVRGTTLRQSIIRMLSRLKPRKIVVVSSAPQIRFPDCYGIDMARLGDFIAFQAAISLLHDRGMENLIDEVYWKCKKQVENPDHPKKNHVSEIYAPFSYNEISRKIGELLTPPDLNIEVEIIYQTLENLHKACPNHTGDWYFSGNYPTPGGNKVINRAFINYYEGKNVRAY